MNTSSKGKLLLKATTMLISSLTLLFLTTFTLPSTIQAVPPSARFTHYKQQNRNSRGKALIPLHGISASKNIHEHFTHGWMDNEEEIDFFLQDLNKIQTVLETKLTTPCYLISRDSSYTKSWTNDDWEKHTARPHRRYLRHLAMWPTSTTMRAIMPVVCAITLWSIAVCFVAEKYPDLTVFLKKASLKTALLSSFMSPLALLLTLRTNRALDRLLDARKAVGLLNRASRSLTGLFCAYVAPTNGKLALLTARYLAIFGWSLKGFLRGESDEEVIRTVLPKEEADWLLSAPADRPIAILTRLRALCSAAATGTSHSLPVPKSAHLHMCNRLYDMEIAIGTCRRILGSPIPPTFTRLTSRLLCLYLGLLPLALLGFGISSGAVVVTSFLTSYILVGMDEIGLEIEHPFPLLPMQQLATAVQQNVMNQVIMMRDMPNASS